jgi:uncharacterized protein YhbP (UPF0306 family)
MAAAISAHGYDSDRLGASVLRILASNTLCVLATGGDAGMVHVSTVFFCFDPEFQLYFLSHPESVHCRQLARVPHMAVAVFDSHQVWGQPHAGLQLSGTGGLADDGDDRPAELYGTRFPRFREFARGRLGERPTSTSAATLKLYRFVPRALQILDEWEFGEDIYIPATVIRHPSELPRPELPSPRR